MIVKIKEAEEQKIEGYEGEGDRKDRLGERTCESKGREWLWNIRVRGERGKEDNKESKGNRGTKDRRKKLIKNNKTKER